MFFEQYYVTVDKVKEFFTYVNYKLPNLLVKTVQRFRWNLNERFVYFRILFSLTLVLSSVRIECQNNHLNNV